MEAERAGNNSAGVVFGDGAKIVCLQKKAAKALPLRLVHG